MCGRYVRSSLPEVFAARFGANGDLDLRPSYNVAPSQPALIARNDQSRRRELAAVRWGLIPFWAKDPKIGYKMINARAETVATKPAYRQAFRRRRCLIAADGFYEWQATEGGKQPFLIRLRDAEPFAFAGLWERWEGEGRVIESCSIIVTDAKKRLREIHDRMPVILAAEAYDQWLTADSANMAALESLLRAYPATLMDAYPVNRAVNSPRNDGPELIERTNV